MAVRVDILPPRYRDPERIGYGGMGEIFRATDSVLGRVVAIKVLAERFSEDAAVRQRFTREALSAARLSGEPNTVTIYDVGEHDGRPYIVMEYLSGGTLDQILRKGGAQPVERVFTWLEEAARALDVAHREGVVHRDVKPANLMLDREGHVHVADFGIASAAGMESLTMTGTVLGTAGYLSPEQAQGERAGPASDRYALAVVAWELLTGRRPYEADSPTAEAAAHVHSAIPSVCDRSALPCELDPVFERALAKDPSVRYPTAGEFVAALRGAFADAAGDTSEIPVVPPPTAATTPLRTAEELRYAPAPSRPPNRSAWPLLAGLLLAGLIGGALLAYFLTRGGDGKPATVVTRIQRVTTQGRVTTVEKKVTVTTAAATAATRPAAAPTPAAPSGHTGESLNDAGYAKMQAGDYSGALPLLEQAVQKLQGTGKLYEAYASYNLAYTRFQLGNCDGVLALLDRAESIEGSRPAIDRLRRDAQSRC